MKAMNWKLGLALVVVVAWVSWDVVAARFWPAFHPFGAAGWGTLLLGCLLLLGRPVREEEKEEAGIELGIDLLDFAEQLSFTAGQLLYLSQASARGSSEVADRMRTMLEQSQLTAREIEGAAAGVEELAASAEEMSAQMEEVGAMTRETVLAAEKNAAHVDKTLAAIEKVSGGMGKVSRAIGDLEAELRGITGLARSINNIADQTNLLALNASIEAARAGEHGRGFAVVADEVRSLAGESNRLAGEIQALVGSLRQKMDEVLEVVSESKANVDAMAAMARESYQTLRDIIAGQDNIKDAMQKLLQVGNEQSQTTIQLAGMTEKVSQASRLLYEGAEECLQVARREEKNASEVGEFARRVDDLATSLHGPAVRLKRADELIFGFNPFVPPDMLKERYFPIIGEVCGGIGYRVRTIITRDSASLARGCREGYIDLAWFSPGAYVLAKAQVDLVPVAIQEIHGERKYRSLFIVRRDSNIKSIPDLKGKKIGYVSRASASGYLFPKAYLKEQGIDPDHFFSQVFFLETHARVVESVLNGMVDVGATYQEPLDIARQKGLPVDELVVIARTREIPANVVVARPSLDPALVERIKAGFLEINVKNERGRRLLAGTYNTGFAEFTDEDFDDLRQVMKILGEEALIA